MADTRYAINMETGVIVPMTSETLGNYIYQEIEPAVAFMVDRGELDAKYVIEQIEKKLPKTSIREKLKLIAKQNVRQSDFGLKEAARAAVDIGESKVVKIPLPKAKNESEQRTDEAETSSAKPKVNI